MQGRTFAVVAKRRETRRSVHEYLARLGAVVRPLREVNKVEDAFDGFVMFPDELSVDEASRTLALLRRHYPDARVVVITNHLDRYPTHDPGVIVLRIPVWGWMIAEALRSSGDGV
ncbi:MAG: hypothetical protein HYV09_30565 [Deltaproteobacteria bacterium]|nr:hypothetical protein [Deltaproteobacteria bacterium]